MRNFGARAPTKERGKMAGPSFPTPLHGHVGRGAFSDVYEPAEDTFLLLDALEAAAAELTGCEEGRVPAGEGSGVLERRRPRTEARTVAALPARRRCRPAWGQLTPEYCN